MKPTTLTTTWCNRLKREGRLSDIEIIRNVLARHPLAKLNGPLGGPLSFSSPAVNLMSNAIVRFHVDAATTGLQAVQMAVYIYDKVLDRKISADPAVLNIGIRNPDGFGIIPLPGLEEAFAENHFSLSARKQALNYLEKSAPVSFLS